MIETKAHPIGARHFNALVQNLGDLVTVHDALGFIRYATPSTARLLGYSEQQLIGKDAFELIHPEDLGVVRAAFAAVLNSTNQGKPTEYRVRRADGVWLDVETIGTNFLSDPAIRGLVLTSRIISERKRHERQMSAITTVAAALRTAPTRADMLPIILDQVIRLLSVDGAAFAILDVASSEVILELGRGCARNLTGLRLPAGSGVSGHVLNTGEPYLSNDVLSDPRFAAPALIEHPAGRPVAAACLPLKANEQTIGALWVEKAIILDAGSGPIDDEQLQLLTAIAEMSANAIYRASLSEQTQLRLHRLMALQTIDMSIARSVDLQVTLNLLLGEITSRLHIDAADVLVMDPARAILKCAASRGFTTGFIARSDDGLGRAMSARTVIGQKTVLAAGQKYGNLPLEIRRVLEAEGFSTYYGLPLIATGQVVGVLELFQRGSLSPDPEWMDYLDGLAAHVAVAVEKVSLIQDLQRSNAELTRAYDGVIEGWSHALAMRDHESVAHARRVTDMTTSLARLVGLDPDQLIHIWRGAMLHDIGEIVLPDAVLLKAGPLSEQDWQTMRQHPLHAYELMSPIDYLRPALDIPYCHHERWDGSGYPRGLKGSEIPVAAQLFSIVDVYDALTSDKPYRAAWSRQAAVDYLRAQAGLHFNAELVEIFARNLPALLGSVNPEE